MFLWRCDGYDVEPLAKRPAAGRSCWKVLSVTTKDQAEDASPAPAAAPQAMPFQATRANYAMYCELYADHPLKKRLTPPCWNVLLSRAERAYRYSYDPCTNTFVCKDTVVVIDDEVFAKGGMRSVYKSFDLEDDVPDWVAKQWLPTMGSSTGTTHRKYFREIFVQAKTQQLVNLFNSVQHEKMCKMNDSYVLQLVERHPVVLFFGERYISGKYKKMNSNDGWVSRSGDFASAFSHYTFKKSSGYALICDIQGVETEDAATWTDPQMHSVDGNAGGAGDLGITGITQFFEKHICGPLCKLLSLENPFTEGKLSETLALSASKPDPQSKQFWRFPTSLPDTLYTASHPDKKELVVEPQLHSVNSSTESLQPTRLKAAPVAAAISQTEVQVLAQKFGQMRRRELGKDTEPLPHFRCVLPNDQLDPSNLREAGVKVLVNPPLRSTPCFAAMQFRPKSTYLKLGEKPASSVRFEPCVAIPHLAPTLQPHALSQVLETDKSLPVPYRPCGAVPIFIRRNVLKIEPLPIIDGQIQENPPKQLDGPALLKQGAKAPPNAVCVALAPAVVKKAAFDPVRARSGKYWK